MTPEDYFFIALPGIAILTLVVVWAWAKVNRLAVLLGIAISVLRYADEYGTDPAVNRRARIALRAIEGSRS